MNTYKVTLRDGKDEITITENGYTQLEVLAKLAHTFYLSEAKEIIVTKI